MIAKIVHVNVGAVSLSLMNKMNYVKFSELVCQEYYKQTDGRESVINVDPAFALIVAGVVLESIKMIKDCSESFRIISEKFRKPTKIQVSVLRKKISDEVGNDKDLTDNILSSILKTAYKLSDEEIQELIESADD